MRFKPLEDIDVDGLFLAALRAEGMTDVQLEDLTDGPPRQFCVRIARPGSEWRACRDEESRKVFVTSLRTEFEHRCAELATMVTHDVSSSRLVVATRASETLHGGDAYDLCYEVELRSDRD